MPAGRSSVVRAGPASTYVRVVLYYILYTPWSVEAGFAFRSCMESWYILRRSASPSSSSQRRRYVRTYVLALHCIALRCMAKGGRSRSSLCYGCVPRTVLVVVLANRTALCLSLHCIDCVGRPAGTMSLSSMFMVGCSELRL